MELSASSWREREFRTADRSDRKGTVRLGGHRVAFLEDSGLILSAEGPLRILFGFNNPGDTGMRLGVLVHFRWLQLENSGGKESTIGNLLTWRVKPELETFKEHSARMRGTSKLPTYNHTNKTWREAAPTLRLARNPDRIWPGLQAKIRNICTILPQALSQSTQSSLWLGAHLSIY